MCTATITNRRIRCASIHPVRFRQPEHQSLLKTVQYIRLTVHAWPRCPSCLASMVLGEGRRYGPGWEKGSGEKGPCMVGRGGRGTLSPAAAAFASTLRALRPPLAPLLRNEPPGVVWREPDGVVWRDPSRDLAREQCMGDRTRGLCVYVHGHASCGVRIRESVNAPGSLTRRLRSSDWSIPPRAALVGGACSCEPDERCVTVVVHRWWGRGRWARGVGNGGG